MWTSVDPAKQYLSSYAYSGNPINGTDSSGKNFDLLVSYKFPTHNSALIGNDQTGYTYVEQGAILNNSPDPEIRNNFLKGQILGEKSPAFVTMEEISRYEVTSDNKVLLYNKDGKFYKQFDGIAIFTTTQDQDKVMVTEAERQKELAENGKLLYSIYDFRCDKSCLMIANKGGISYLEDIIPLGTFWDAILSSAAKSFYHNLIDNFTKRQGNNNETHKGDYPNDDDD